MKILFCTDGSECSIHSFENMSYYVNSAVVDIICVVDWTFLPTSMTMEKQSYTQVYEKIADEVLNFASEIVKKNEFEIGKKIKAFGSPSEEITQTIENDDYDLIVLGSHGKKGFQKWIGSVSRQVVSRTNVPCFVSKNLTKNHKTLITTDGSECSFNYIKYFAKNFDIKDKEISVLNVKESPEYFPVDAAADKNWLEALEKEQKIYAAKSINKVKAILKDKKVEVANEIILTGNPAQEIIDYCRKDKIDLVVMGSRKRNDLSKILLGSVSKRVLENVDCGVLVIGCS